MTHADYEVKWKDYAERWVVIRKVPSGRYKEVSQHRKKKPAKKKAKKLAKQDGTSLAYYSKDDRRVYTTDF